MLSKLFQRPSINDASTAIDPSAASQLGPIHPSDERCLSFFNAGNTNSGVIVNPQTALQFAAYYDAVRIIAEDIAKLSQFVYRRSADGGRDKDPGHPVFKLLHSMPNDEQTAFTFRELIVSYALGSGNGYAEIVRLGNGDPAALIPLHPNRVDVVRSKSRRIVYDIWNESGSNTVLEAMDVYHIKGMGCDGIKGFSPAHLARESLGLSIAAERLGQNFFGNGAMVALGLEHPNDLGDVGRKNIRDSFGETYGGVNNAFKLLIAEEGMKFKDIGMKMEDAQLLQTREFQVVEIARWFRLPPHKLASLANATFSNIEHQAIEYVVDTLLPWAVRIDQESNWKLFKESERNTFFSELLLTSLLRGDSQARFNTYHQALQDGWMNRDEVRAFENMNPMPDGQGKVFLFPLNFAPADKVISGESSSGSNATASRSSILAMQKTLVQISDASVRVFEDVADRILAREYKAITRATNKYDDPDEYNKWMAKFCDEQKSFVRAQLIAPTESMIELLNLHLDDKPNVNKLACKCCDGFAESHCESLLNNPAMETWKDQSLDMARGWCNHIINEVITDIGDYENGKDN